MQLYLGALLTAVLVAVRGLRSASLSPSGALAASILGYAALASPLKVFSACLLGFYFAGSKATKVKAAVKATYEEPEAPSIQQKASASSPTTAPPHSTPSSAGRTATQVACNALVGAFCAVTWRVFYSGERAGAQDWAKEGAWCVVGLDPRGRTHSRALVLAAVAFWAACCGDTFASELGILSRSPPRLLTTLRPCPRGTNGGVSPWGTLVSLLGGLLVGLLAVASLAAQRQTTACGAWGWAVEIVAVAGAAGLGGSLLDSLLGATLQATYFSKTRNLVVHAPHPSPAFPDDEIVRVPGSGFAVLSNNGVNLVSAAAVAAVAGAWAAQ
ncbi:integral membrane protein DUF92-domain-containing protein [Rhodotorula diobovata]|uniref:Integral membrane protein DUF92-domain-containing protein n=1 Tax=Rhodotorula diobovata TaxID=5288 RepID=A0A5C5FPL0_9BASI|nr:integral membrane protein DUF92-domain-containing protein [Rhodotorula diobovata]